MRYLGRLKSQHEIQPPKMVQESPDTEPQKSHDDAMIDPGATGGTKEKAGREQESEKQSKNLSVQSNAEENNSDLDRRFEGLK